MAHRYEPRDVVENAVLALVTAGINGQYPFYPSDYDTAKETRPWGVVTALACEEVIGPGSGIFDAEVEIAFESHVKLTSSAGRDDIGKMIAELPYIKGQGTIQERLSRYDNFHCYGWQDRGSTMEVGTDRKTYRKVWVWLITFMPRNNDGVPEEQADPE